MKVRCVDCKKRFDYELYSGVCPKCGNYMRLTEIETSENENCNVEGSHVHIPSTHVEPAKEKKTNKVLTIILAVAMVLTAVVTIIFVAASQKNAHEEKVIKEPLPIKMQSLSDAITYKSASNQYDIYIDSLKVDPNPAFMLPDEYEAIQLSYHIDRTFLGGEGIDYDNYYEIQMEVYVETESGEYLAPVSDYHMRKLLNLEYEDTKEMGIGPSFDYEQGVIYFFVKKEDVKDLYIVTADYDEEEYGAGKLREVIRVEGLEVDRSCMD